MNKGIGSVTREAGPWLLAFVTSACVMSLEIVASRLVAQHVGNSLYTWTSIIAVVLAGISLGNFAGGLVADKAGRDNARRLLSVVLGLAALAAVGILWVHAYAFDRVSEIAIGWPLRVVLGVTLTFFLPSALLGGVSPAIAKWAIDRSDRIGSTMGRVYAFGAFGSIFGTLITGFILIGMLGTATIIGLIGLILAVTAFLLRANWVTGAALILVIGLLFLAGLPRGIGWLDALLPRYPVANPGVVYFDESGYQTITVVERDGLFTMVMDDLIHGYIDPRDPTTLTYEYLQFYAALYDVAREAAGRPLESLHLGGGAFTFPRYLSAAYFEDAATVIEIDPEVTRASIRAMGLPDPPPFSVIHEDARQGVKALAADGAQFDVVFSDAFQGFALPFHLGTVEFLREVRSALSPTGLFAANLIDVHQSGKLLGAFVNTAQAAFPNVAVLATRPPADDGYRDTFVVVGSIGPIDLTALSNKLAASGAYVLGPEDLELLEARSGGLVLTDDYAPIDNLVAQWSQFY